MDRLTRPGIDADQTAVRFMDMDGEVKIQDIGDKLLDLILNGPTINGIKKDTLRHLVRQLYAELKRYEDTEANPEELTGMLRSPVYIAACVLNGAAITHERAIEIAKAEVEGRLTIIPPPAKEGDPKPSCFYNDNGGLWCNGMAPQDGDEPTERCKQCWYCLAREEEE